MASEELQARHVFHAPTTGWDRIHAWQETAREPVFVWGTGSGHNEGRFFSSVKRAFRLWLEATNGASITIYHDGAGVDALGALDDCPHKILFLHHWFSRWERNFEWAIRCSGKVLVGHPDHIGKLRQRFGWIPERFIQAIPQPVLQMAPSPSEGGGAKQRTGIWLHGRPWRRHGNRLRAIIDRWPADAGQLEIISSGKGCPSWAKKDHITWSTNLPLEFALYRLHTWDSTLLINDYSLDAPWLMAALGLDCFPLIPEGDGISRNSGWNLDSAPRPYPWGDIPAVIDLLANWRNEKDKLLGDFRSWVDTIQEQQLPGDGFPAEWNQVKGSILGQRAPNLRPRKAISSWQPVAWYERIQRLRAGA